jgi:hypothetical protein
MTIIELIRMLFDLLGFLMIIFLLCFILSILSTKLLMWLIQPKNSLSEKKNKKLSFLFFMMLYILLVFIWLYVAFSSYTPIQL